MPAGDDCDPFEAVRVVRERDDDGQPTGWYTIIGEREGWERHRQVRGETLLAQADQHLEVHQGKGPGDPVNGDEWQHALIRSAAAFLMG